jgi:hypothetical protein
MAKFWHCFGPWVNGTSVCKIQMLMAQQQYKCVTNTNTVCACRLGKEE